MANAAVIQTLQDGPRWLIVKGTLILDTSDLVETLVADPLTAFVDPTGATTRNFEIVRATWSCQGSLAIRFQWKATTNAEALVCAGADHQDFEKKGGAIYNNAGAGKNGQLVMITNGWVTITAMNASFELKLRKVN